MDCWADALEARGGGAGGAEFGGDDDDGDFALHSSQQQRRSAVAAVRRRSSGGGGGGPKRAKWAQDVGNIHLGLGGAGAGGSGAFVQADAEEEQEQEEDDAGTTKRVRYRVTTREVRLRDKGADPADGGAGTARVIETTELRDRFMRSCNEGNECPLCEEGFMFDSGEAETTDELKLRSMVEELLAWGEDLEFVFLYVSRFRRKFMPQAPQWSVDQVRHHLSKCIRLIDVMVERDIQNLDAAADSALGCSFRGEWESRTGSHQMLGAYLNLVKCRYTLLQMDRTKLRARVRGRR